MKKKKLTPREISKRIKQAIEAVESRTPEERFEEERKRRRMTNIDDNKRMTI